MAHKHPEILAHTIDDQQRYYDIRQNMDLVNADYRRYCERIIHQMMQHFAQNTAIADRKQIATTERQYNFPIILRSGTNAQGHQVHYFFNYTYQPQQITYPYATGTLLTGESSTTSASSIAQTIKPGTTLTLEPWDVGIVVEQ